MSHYRFSKKQFNFSLCTLGIIRVGTLYDFRKSEHEKGIADINEGKKTLVKKANRKELLNFETSIVKGIDGEDMMIRMHKGTDGLGYGVIGPIDSDAKNFSNYEYRSNLNSPDCFVLCFTSSNTSETRDQFDGVDSCIIINNFMKFIELVALSINKTILLKNLEIYPVTYKSREEKWDTKNLGTNPVFIKEHEFSKQFEIRVAFHPKYKVPLQPLFIANYELGKYCSFVDIKN